MDASNLLKPALAVGRAALHRLDDLPGVQVVVRARPRAGAPLPEDRGPRADRSRRPSQILKGLRTQLRGAPRRRLHRRGAARPRPSCRRKYINDRHLPDKAIDVIDEAGAADPPAGPRRRGTKTLDAARDRDGRRAGWPRSRAKTVSARDEDALAQARARRCKKVIFGQDKAIEALVAAIKLSRAGLGRRSKPIGSFLFSGPTGVGKTELAKQLAQDPRRRVHALRHDRVHGEAHGVAPHRRAAGLRRLRPGRPAHRRHAQDAATRCSCSTRSRRRTPTSSTSCSR